MFPHDRLMAITVLPCIPRFVSPNAVTIVRFLCIPFVVLLLIREQYALAIPVFLGTAFTDVIDGSLARVRNQVTEWGTLYDPVADKMLIGSSLAVLVVKYLHPFIAVTMITMECIFLTGGFIKKRKGEISSPSWFGKFKMLFQTLGITFVLLSLVFDSVLFLSLSTVAFLTAILLGLLNVIKYGIQLAN